MNNVYGNIDKKYILQCIADELMNVAFNNSYSGNYHFDTKEIKEDTKERFKIELTEDDITTISEIMEGDDYILEAINSNDCYDEDGNSLYEEDNDLDVMCGYGRIIGGYEFDEEDEEEQELYDFRMKLYDKYCEKNEMNYDQYECLLILPNGVWIEDVLSSEQATKLYDDYIFSLIDNDNIILKQYEKLLKAKTILDNAILSLQVNCNFNNRKIYKELGITKKEYEDIFKIEI